MSSIVIKSVVFAGIVASFAINIIAPRLGVTPVPPAASSPPPVYGGARLVPPPPGMR